MLSERGSDRFSWESWEISCGAETGLEGRGGSPLTVAASARGGCGVGTACAEESFGAAGSSEAQRKLGPLPGRRTPGARSHVPPLRMYGLRHRSDRSSSGLPCPSAVLGDRPGGVCASVGRSLQGPRGFHAPAAPRGGRGRSPGCTGGCWGDPCAREAPCSPRTWPPSSGTSAGPERGGGEADARGSARPNCQGLERLGLRGLSVKA